MPASRSSPPSQQPLVVLLLMLSITTGLVDASSVLGLGKVFTANMTGNVVFLGFAAAGAKGFKALPLAVAIGSFLVGALIGGSTGKAHGGGSERRWLMVAALIETALLWSAAAIAHGFDGASQAPAPRLLAIIALTGVAMGFRNATIRQLKVADLTTTVLTMTLTGLGADSAPAGGGNPNWKRRIAAVIAIFTGAVLGAFLLTQAGIAAPLAAAGALVLLATLAFVTYPAK